MHRLDRAEFESATFEYDRAVAADPVIDGFCSRSAWVLSFHAAFRPGAALHVAREGDAFVALTAVDEPQMGIVLQPLEAMWGFASALIGDGSCDLLRQILGDLALAGARVPLLLTGVPTSRSRLDPLLRMLAADFALRPLRETVRFQASLDGGFDGWLGRRSAGFRRNLRAARRRTHAAGVIFESASPRDASTTAAVYERVLAIERHSWKTQAGNGVERGPMREFYARMLPRLAARGELRVLIATRAGSDLGYLYGGIAGDLFRGLQFSFCEAARGLGLGNALQAELLERLCVEGIATYDLGSQSEYKRHWSEPGLVTLGLLARPRG
jgi:CelD/BcsL family acetyltransferase involved in cellulose biosynthesis